MCTITYLPLKGGYILTQSRDESPLRRPATFPHFLDNEATVYPKDMEAGGTWIGLSAKGRTMCVLNGAFEPHERNPPYKKSRGLVMIDALQHSNSLAFTHEYRFEGIEPFTIVSIEEPEGNVYVWDGQTMHASGFALDKPKIWSSVPLYPADIRMERESWFEAWYEAEWIPAIHNLSENEDSERYMVRTARTFHYDEGTRDPDNAIMMDRRGMVRTVSVTTTYAHKGVRRMYYQSRNETEPDAASVSIHQNTSKK
ncbi:NRDE family protein [Roseivirga sp. BDSF3-8]|uniref:NRDE family protein n=1 Tax=Roseivirga sp. BDSF3-8 TaxID=3241598 RepID=UPI0035321B11